MNLKTAINVYAGLAGFLLFGVAIDAHAETVRDDCAIEGNKFYNASHSHMPQPALSIQSKDARFADLDGDSDLDLLIANEYKPNVVLINDGDGRFANESGARLPQLDRDTEDIFVGDFNQDGFIDALFVSEDDSINELYINGGKGKFFTSELDATGISNGVAGADINGDGHLDIVIGNNGQNVFLLGDGAGGFADETQKYLPARRDSTQDAEFGDVDGDGDLDLLFGNEDGNRLLINTGSGGFRDESQKRLPFRDTHEETREADFGDIDGDGDLDIIFANVGFRPASDPRNRLLRNNGAGVFVDITRSHLPMNSDYTMDADFVDLDLDGDLDLLTTGLKINKGLAPVPVRIFTNDGKGKFTLSTSAFLCTPVMLVGTDTEAADVNGDGAIDLFFTNRSGPDILMIGSQQNGHE